MGIKPVQNFYTSPLLKKGLKFASENSALVTAGTSLALSLVARPAAIALTPKTERDDKKISAIKSIASALTGFLFMALFSMPLAKGVKKIDADPSKYLNGETLKNLSGSADKTNIENIGSSKAYQFITQLFKLGLGAALALPKALLTNALVGKIYNPKTNTEPKTEPDTASAKRSLLAQETSKQPTFKGLDNFIAKAINNENLQKTAKKLQNTNYTTAMICAGDIISTLAFVGVTQKNKKLDERKKKVLSYNALISTALCITAGSAIDKALERPLLKFCDNLKKFNPDCTYLSKLNEGAKIVKTSLIFGLIYYCLIPVVSTYISSKLASAIDNKSQNLS